MKTVPVSCSECGAQHLEYEATVSDDGQARTTTLRCPECGDAIVETFHLAGGFAIACGEGPRGGKQMHRIPLRGWVKD